MMRSRLEWSLETEGVFIAETYSMGSMGLMSEGLKPTARGELREYPYGMETVRRRDKDGGDGIKKKKKGGLTAAFA